MSATEIYNWLVERAKTDGFIAVRGACRKYLKEGQKDGVVATKRKYIPPKVRAEVWGRQHGKCHRCGLDVSFDDAVIDHLIPIAEGGKDHKSNYRAMHPTCNGSKGAKMPMAESKASGRTLLEQLR